MTDDEQIEQHVRDALADLMAKIDTGGMVTGYALLIEVVGSDGERALWTMAPSESKAWDTLGLLQYGLTKQQAQMHAAEFICDEDDD